MALKSENMGNGAKESVFQDLQAENPNEGITEIESLCMNCHENGTTKLLLTIIPFYKEIIISSFSCDSCGFSNNGIQSGAAIQEKGVTFKLKVTSVKDLDREIIKSDYSSIKIPEIDFEVPASTQPGEITTIEGVIDRAINGLSQTQQGRDDIDVETTLKIANFISKLTDLKEVSEKFTFIIEDCSGNSFIQNPLAPINDPNLEISHFSRTLDHEVMLGLKDADQVVEKVDEVQTNAPVNTEEEVLNFPTNCSNCNCPCETKMKVTKIPYFKEVIIMATTCDACGYRTNEIKSGSGIEEKGKRIELEITHSSDMNRDVLKSETCKIIIPEIDLEVGEGILGGKFTTVEGLLVNIKEQLSSDNPFVLGDSANSSMKSGMKKFFEKLEQIKDCSLPVHIILDDPCGNSYLQNLYAPEDDPKMKITFYERTFEQNEELGLNDMKTEGYETNT